MSKNKPTSQAHQLVGAAATTAAILRDSARAAGAAVPLGATFDLVAIARVPLGTTQAVHTQGRPIYHPNVAR